MHLSQFAQILRLTARSTSHFDAQQTMLFSDYTQCAQACLNTYSYGTNCLSYSTQVQQSSCLCSDTSFTAIVAQCTYNNCGYMILEDTASAAVSNCDTANTPSPWTVQQIINAGMSGKSKTIQSVSYLP